MTPLKMRLSSSLSDSLILKIFLLALLVRINPLVKVRTAGVEFWFGPALFWFSVVHPHRSIPSRPAGVGLGASSTMDRDPPPPRSAWMSRDLALPSRPQGFRSHVDTSSVPAPTSGGVVRSPHERLALSSEPTSGGQPLPSRSPSPGLCPDKPCLTSSVLTFPKQCLTGFVLTMFISECHACLGSVLVFLFPHQSKQG